MQVEAIKLIKLIQMILWQRVLDRYIKTVYNEDIIVITSKIISIIQGRLVSKEAITKRLLVQQEADLILEAQKKSL